MPYCHMTYFTVDLRGIYTKWIITKKYEISGNKENLYDQDINGRIK